MTQQFAYLAERAHHVRYNFDVRDKVQECCCGHRVVQVILELLTSRHAGPQLTLCAAQTQHTLIASTYHIKVTERQ